MTTSVQVLARHGDAMVGAARLVLPSALGLPTERLFDVVPPAVPREHLGEFSRLAIVAEHRGESRVPMLGLVRMVVECMDEADVTHLCAFMPAKLIESLVALDLNPVDLNVQPPAPETLATTSNRSWPNLGSRDAQGACAAP